MGALQVIDHTEPRWQERYRTHGRQNGAATYSHDIVQHHVPLWRAHTASMDVVLSSCPRMLNMPELRGDLAVQYLHEYRYGAGMSRVKEIQGQLKYQFSRVIFVTSYKSLATQINAEGAGFEAVFVPMAIDTAKVLSVSRMPDRGEKVAAYFGNILGAKQPRYRDLVKIFTANGWSLEHVKGPQYTAWQDLTGFRYGVGVGRCAQEMLYLGLKTMISGQEFGGIITNEHEWLAQRDTNFNGRVVTFDRDPVACLNSWDLSISHRAVDVADAMVILEEHLQRLFA